MAHTLEWPVQRVKRLLLADLRDDMTEGMAEGGVISKEIKRIFQ